jgi:DNA-binding NarL/FixJ family response regulator
VQTANDNGSEVTGGARDPANKIRIVVVDDHKIVRDGLRRLLEIEPDMEVVGEAQNGAEAEKIVEQLRPDVAIMDICMPQVNGIEATRRIATSAHTKVIGLSMHSGRWLRKQMAQVGASAYLQKDCAYSELIQTIRDVVAGKTVSGVSNDA